MTGWSELVTTALLGTDRRPVPHDLPSGWVGPRGGSAGGEQGAADPTLEVLGLAARHRVAAQAGAPPLRLPSPSTAPPERLPPAPAEAQELLGELLRRPEPAVVNLWLAECAGRGLGVIPDLWPRLAQLAVRNKEYDRPALLAVLGPRGRWFLTWFPDGARLAAPVEPRPDPTQPGTPGGDLPAAGDAGSGDRALQLLLAVPDPWSAQLAQAAVQLLAEGGLGPQTRTAAVLIGSRLPLELAEDLVAAAAVRVAGSPPRGIGALRVAEVSLALVERTVRSRVEIRTAFSSAEPTGEPPRDVRN